MKKMMTKLVAGALALSVLVPSASFAATNAVTNTDHGIFKKGVHQSFKKMNHEQHKADHEELMALIKKYTPELEGQFQTIFDNMQKNMEQKHPQLDEATKQKLDEIKQKHKDGTLTKEQVKAELEKLGIKPHNGKGEHPQLDEATKQKLDEIKQKLKDGTLTKEQAKAEFKKLRINFHIGDRKNDIHQQLKQAVEAKDETKIKELLKELLTKLQNNSKS